MQMHMLFLQPGNPLWSLSRLVPRPHQRQERVMRLEPWRRCACTSLPVYIIVLYMHCALFTFHCTAAALVLVTRGRPYPVREKRATGERSSAVDLGNMS